MANGSNAQRQKSKKKAQSAQGQVMQSQQNFFQPECFKSPTCSSIAATSVPEVSTTANTSGLFAAANSWAATSSSSGAAAIGRSCLAAFGIEYRYGGSCP
jgi:hypothetical protein